MLTRDLAICEFREGRVLPDRLTTVRHAHYRRYAERMLEIYQQGTGRTREELHREVHHLFARETDCPIRRIDAFCKLLDDVATYDRDRRGQARELRREVFHRAAALHPLVRSADRLFEHEEARVKAQIAAELGRSWAEIDQALFADVMQFHRLKKFKGYTDAVALLSRYNVAQVQAVLYDALSMTVWASEDLKTILRYAKLARLMHTISRPREGQYVFQFDGPASVLRQTRRYGVAMARFLPALLACRGWRMHAVIQSSRAGWRNALDLSPADGLRSHLPEPEEFDSQVERTFAEKWGDAPREGWTLLREAEVLHIGQHVFVPDFAFRHHDGRQVLLEIVGFWTPEYLAHKRDTLVRFREHPILLAVAESVAKASSEIPDDTIRYKTTLRVNDVMERLACINR